MKPISSTAVRLNHSRYLPKISQVIIDFPDLVQYLLDYIGDILYPPVKQKVNTEFVRKVKLRTFKVQI